VPDDRSSLILGTFTTLADSITSSFDAIELLQYLAEQCNLIFDGADAGILLRAPEGDIQVIASSSGRARVTDNLELALGEGPCIEAIDTGSVVSAASKEEIAQRWPAFSVRTVEVGYDSVHAVPLHLRQTILGSLNLFLAAPGGLSRDDALLARAFADNATISIMQHRALQNSESIQQQLKMALVSRVPIEQAKGALSAKHVLEPDEAFDRLRRYARTNRRSLIGVAEDVLSGELDL
jgi:GAF domain-containing protein